MHSCLTTTHSHQVNSTLLVTVLFNFVATALFQISKSLKTSGSVATNHCQSERPFKTKAIAFILVICILSSSTKRVNLTTANKLLWLSVSALRASSLIDRLYRPVTSKTMVWWMIHKSIVHQQSISAWLWLKIWSLRLPLMHLKKRFVTKLVNPSFRLWFVWMNPFGICVYLHLLNALF